MSIDPRVAGARFYDLQPFPADVPFYQGLIGEGRPHLLELGCGTGRVMRGLSDRCATVSGVELSPSMLEIAQDRAEGEAGLWLGDITDFYLPHRYDLILLPFRVFQALESDAQVDGLLRCIRAHLKPGGSCVLTAFRPRFSPEDLRARWASGVETQSWERSVGDERIVAFDRRRSMDPDTLVLHPELVFRVYRGGDLVEETVMPIVMRCWYPTALEPRLARAGFRITGRWGGYAGEPYGVGDELILRLQLW